jgi:hypothetical protein
MLRVVARKSSRTTSCDCDEVVVVSQDELDLGAASL